MAIMDADAVFLDTNILVYANVAEAPLHHLARQAIEVRYQAGADLWISRQVLREYLAVLSRPQVFADPQPASLLIERARYFESHFRVADEDSCVTERLLALVEGVPCGGRQIHDANIVATMLAYEVPCLLTHNTPDFARFTRHITVIPLVAAG